jgi:hypothetical protein
MYKLFLSGVNAMDNYMGDNLCPGNVMNNLSRVEKLRKRLKNHRAVQRRWRLGLGLIRNPKAFKNAK